MSIRTKVLLLSFILLSFLSIGLTIGVIYQLQQNLNAELENYRQEQLTEAQDALKNLVDIAYTSVEADYRSFRDQQVVEMRYGHRLRNVIDLAEALTRHYMAQVEAQAMSLEEAQADALSEIKRMRYDSGTGYIWVNDTTHPVPIMLMHPTVPALDGKVMDSPKYDKIALNKTKNLFVAFLEVCEQHGEGFVDYIWPKPTADGKLVPDVPKLSYVRLLPEWGWILGTGVYMDDAEHDVIERIQANLRKMHYNEDEGYFWINDTQLPYPTMVMHAQQPDLEGAVMQGGHYTQPDGSELGSLLVDAVQDKGAGFVNYLWPKTHAGGNVDLHPKLAYLRLYEPLGWIIGSSIFIDDIDEDILIKEQEVRQQISEMRKKIIWFTSVVFVLVALVLSVLLQRFITPLLRVNHQLQILAEGKLAEGNIVYHGQDEIADMIKAFVRLREKIGTTIRQARAVASGDYNQQSAHSKEDQLGTALADMTEALRLAAEKSARQDWLKTGQTGLNKALRGGHQVADLTHNTLAFFHDYLSTFPALFYVSNLEAHEMTLDLYASSGFERRQYLTNHIALGEGLSGQAALERSLIIIAEKRSQESFIDAPYILAMPFFYEDKLGGVIELGRAEPFSDLHIEFLKLISQDIAIAIRAAQIYSRH